MILEAECANGGDAVGGEVYLGDGVVLLQGHVGLAAVRRHGDVLGLQVLRHRGVGAEDAHGRRQLAVARAADVEVREADGRHAGAADAAGEVHDGHAALGIDAVPLVVGVGLALVRDDDPGAIRREGDHVRQRADVSEALLGAGGGVEEVDAARLLGVAAVLDGDGDDAVLDRDAVRNAKAGEAGQAGDVGTGGGVEHIDARLCTVHHIHLLRGRVVRDDLRSTTVEDAGHVRPALVQVDERLGEGAGRGAGDGGSKSRPSDDLHAGFPVVVDESGRQSLRQTSGGMRQTDDDPGRHQARGRGSDAGPLGGGAGTAQSSSSERSTI